MIRNQHVFHFMERVKENFFRTNFRAFTAYVRRERLIKSHIKRAVGKKSSRLIAVWHRHARLKRARRRVLRKTIATIRRRIESQALHEWRAEAR